MNASSDFSKKTVSQLAKKGVTVIGKTAIPAFDGDVYFSGTARSKSIRIAESCKIYHNQYTHISKRRKLKPFAITH